MVVVGGMAKLNVPGGRGYIHHLDIVYVITHL